MAEKIELVRVLGRLGVLESCLDTVRDLLGEADIHTKAIGQIVGDMMAKEEDHARED